MRFVPRSLQRKAKALYYPRLLRNYREEQWPEASIVRRFVRPGDHVVDAGANIGYISLLLSRMVGPGGRVHAFEPVPATFDLLSGNLRSLGIRQVQAKRVGVSDRRARVRMATPDYADGGENLYESRIVGAGEGFEAEVAPLDELLGPDAAKVVFVKIDVEGHELAAVRGARALLRAARPVLLIEVSGDPDTAGPASELFAELADGGYRPFRNDAGRLVARSPGDRAVDYYFLTAAAEQRFRDGTGCS